MEVPLLKLDDVPLALSIMKLEGSRVGTRGLFSVATSQTTSRATSFSQANSRFSVSRDLSGARLSTKKKKLNKLVSHVFNHRQQISFLEGLLPNSVGCLYVCGSFRDSELPLFGCLWLRSFPSRLPPQVRLTKAHQTLRKIAIGM